MSDPVTAIPGIRGAGLMSNLGYVSAGIVIGIIVVIITIIIMFGKVFANVRRGGDADETAAATTENLSSVAEENARNHAYWLQKELSGQ